MQENIRKVIDTDINEMDDYDFMMREYYLSLEKFDEEHPIPFFTYNEHNIPIYYGFTREINDEEDENKVSKVVIYVNGFCRDIRATIAEIVEFYRDYGIELNIANDKEPTPEFAFNHTMHVKLWDKIIELLKDPEYHQFNTYELKKLAWHLVAKDGDDQPLQYCYACDYVKNLVDANNRTMPCEKNCPLIGMGGCSLDDSSLYHRFCSSFSLQHLKDEDKAVYIATLIRNTQVRKGVKTI